MTSINQIQYTQSSEKAKIIQKAKSDRFNRLAKFKRSIAGNELTYLSFGFKTDERNENIYLKDFTLQQNLIGMMSIADLWSQKQISKYLDLSKLSKENLLLQQMYKSQKTMKIIKLPETARQSVIDNRMCNKKSIQEIIGEINLMKSQNKNLKKLMYRGKLDALYTSKNI